MEAEPSGRTDADFVITDLETGKKYRVNEGGDQVEISEGEHVPVDEFLDLFGYLRLPKTDPGGPEAQTSSPRRSSEATPEGFTRFVKLIKSTKRRISESPSVTLSRQSVRDHAADQPQPVVTNKRSEKCLSDLRLVQELKVHQGVVWVMQFSPDRSMLASGGEDGNVYVWRVLEKRDAVPPSKVEVPVFEAAPMRTFQGHKADILDLCWSHKSEFVLSASLDKSVRLWHIKRENCLREFPHVNYVTSIRFHPADSGKFISGQTHGCMTGLESVVGSGDGVLRLWDIAEYKVVASASIASEKDIFTALCFSSDGRTIVAGCFDGRCRIYNLVGHRLEKRAEIDVKNRTGKHRRGTKVTGIVEANAGENTFLVSTHDSRVRLLQATTPPRHLGKFKGHENDSGRPIVASPTSDGLFVVSGSDDGRVYVWNNATRPFKRQEREKISEWECFQAHHGFCPTALFCPDNCRRSYEKLDVGSPSGNNYRALMRMIGLDSPEAENLPAEFRLWGQLLVTGGSRGEIRIWENFGVPATHQ